MLVEERGFGSRCGDPGHWYRFLRIEYRTEQESSSSAGIVTTGGIGEWTGTGKSDIVQRKRKTSV